MYYDKEIANDEVNDRVLETFVTNQAAAFSPKSTQGSQISYLYITIQKHTKNNTSNKTTKHYYPKLSLTLK